MRTLFQVLSEEERHQIHERSLKVLAEVGVRVDTAKGRKILKDAGADVNESTHLVRFPREFVEECLRVTTRDFSLGARRPDWDLPMNADESFLLIDGEAVYVYDQESGERYPGTYDDWLKTTKLIDALDEVGLYWAMVEGSPGGEGQDTSNLVMYWRDLFGNFSKHIQDGIEKPEDAPWLLEAMQIVFGDKETIRREHPYSFLICPQSPLIITEEHTDAYLALDGWDVPVAVMPMPLMGATAPGSHAALIVQTNCEVLSTLCLIQAAAPGTPFIYAPALALVDPRTGRYGGGGIDLGLLGAAGVEMARYYGLPAEGSGMGTDHHIPGIQAGYERAMTGLLPMLAWPDILVGAGLLGGSLNLSLEQLIIDVELFRMCKRANRGIVIDDDKWLHDVVEKIGSSGNFLGEKSTRAGMRGGEWHISHFGHHDSFDAWVKAGRPELLDEARQVVDHLLETHEPLPLSEEQLKEFDRLDRKAREVAH